eukprot:9632115-Alexandrium_andersonii.AAC.1
MAASVARPAGAASQPHERRGGRARPDHSQRRRVQWGCLLWLELGRQPQHGADVTGVHRGTSYIGI